MPFTTPKTWATNEVVTAANMNTHVRDNISFLAQPPQCSCSGNTVSLADSTDAALSAPNESFDNDSMHSTSSNTSRITINTAGRYLFTSRVRFAVNGSGARVTHYRVNGGTFVPTNACAPPPGGTSDALLPGVWLLILSATDYVEVGAFQNSGGALNVKLEEFTAVLFNV